MDRDQRAAYGPVIRETRKAMGYDQATIAEMTGVSRRTIGSIERGDTVAQRDVLERLLTVLNLKPIEVDPDVRALVAVLEPLLQQVPQDRRARLLIEIMETVVLEVRRAATMATRLEWPEEAKAAWLEESARRLSDATPTVPDAIAAHEDGSIAGEQESTNET